MNGQHGVAGDGAGTPTGRRTETSESPLLLTAGQVAQLIQVSPRTLWRLVSSNKVVRPVKVGGATRWRRAMVEQWIAAGCPEPTREKA
jgi:excisionase family DNA binding protein